jgi:hypothetical protein
VAAIEIAPAALPICIAASPTEDSRRDDHRVTGNEPCHVDQRAIGRQVLHPDRRRLLPGEVGRFTVAAAGTIACSP